MGIFAVNSEILEGQEKKPKQRQREGDEKTNLSSRIVTSRTTLGSALINRPRHA